MARSFGFSEGFCEVVLGRYDEGGRDVRAQGSDRAEGCRVEGGGDDRVARAPAAEEGAESCCDSGRDVAVGFQLHVHDAAGACVQGRCEGGHRRAGQPAERFAVEDGVVVHHERAVGCSAHVQLHAVGAQREGQAEGLGGVLRSGAGGAAVSQHKRASHAPQG